MSSCYSTTTVVPATTTNVLSRSTSSKDLQAEGSHYACNHTCHATHQSIVAEQTALTHTLTETANVRAYSAVLSATCYVQRRHRHCRRQRQRRHRYRRRHRDRHSNDIILTQPHGVTVKQTINSTRKQTTNDSHVSTINNFNNKGSVGSRPML